MVNNWIGKMAYVPILLMIAVVLLLAGIVPSAGTTQGVFFSPVLWFFLVLLGLWSVVAAVWFWRRGFWFLWLHLAVGIGICGVLIGYFFGERKMIRVPYDIFTPTYLSEFAATSPRGQMGQAEMLKLPFSFCVKRFVVEKFPPNAYTLYQAIYREGGYSYEPISQLKPFEMIAEDGTPLGMCVSCCEVENMPDDLLTPIKVAELRGDNQWVWSFELPLDYGFFLRANQTAIKHYEATLEFEGESETQRLRVNHPVSKEGWLLYLMDYDQQRGSYIVLSVRRDPGRWLVIASIWMLIVSSFGLCLKRQRKEVC